MIRDHARQVGFELSVSARADGTLEAVYITLLNDKVARTDEVMEDILLADYNQRGELVGIEILAPVKINKLAQLVDKDRRPDFRRFVKQQAPEELVLSH